MASKGRSVFRMILTNFVNSLKPKRRHGDLVGKDTLGNSYFEIPAEPSKGKRKPERYFESKVRNEYIQEVPAEWEAWLRGRRATPPNENEIERNMARLQATLEKVAELEKKEKPLISTETQIDKLEKKAFPKFEEYELEPGKPRNEK